MSNVKNVIESEEKRFLETIENGMDRLDEIMKSVMKSGAKAISGNDASTVGGLKYFESLSITTELTRQVVKIRPA